METGGEEINPGGQEISPGTSENCHWVVAEAKREGRFWKREGVRIVRTECCFGDGEGLPPGWVIGPFLEAEYTHGGMDLARNSSRLKWLEIDVRFRLRQLCPCPGSYTFKTLF